ncbi:MAG: leucine-rich repeat protein [Anaerovoracaceae bacterium]
MKRLLSMLISIALMATSVLCVDFSAAAADDDIPNYVTFQAECYGMDDVYNVFQVGTYNHEFAQAFKKNSEFQSSVAAWETANNLLNPASAASTSFDKVQYYELMLFDIIDQASKNQNLLKYFSNRYVNYVISATKKITTTLSELDCTAALTAEKAAQVNAMLSQASDLSEALKQTSQIVGMSKTVIDYVLNLSRYQITFDLTSYEIDVLKMIRDNTDDTYLKAAVAEVIGYQQNAMSRTLVEAIQLAEFSVEIIFDVAVSALWSAISAPIAGLNLIYKGTKAAVDAWLATDDIISAYYSIAALDSFETTLRSCMDSLRAQFQNSATAENAERFMAAIGFYEKSALLGCDYVEKILDAQYKKAAWSLIFKSENEMMDRYNAVENYRSVASNAFTSIEDSVNSLYVKKYFSDYDDLLSLTDQSGKYVPITGLSCTDGKVTLAVNENRYLAVSYTPTNTTETQVNYTCTDPSIATVDACGFITGVAEGTTSVTICSAADDGLSVTVPITVSGVYDPVTGKTSYTDADGNQTEVTDAHYKDYTYSVSNGAATITKYTGNARNLYVPSTLGGYPVKRINDQVFRGCKFETAVLPNQLETIGAYAFQNCVRLISVTLPESLTAMYGCVFSGCTKLKSLTVPQYVTQMHSHWNATDHSSLEESSIETVVFEGGRDSIPYRACANVSSLKTVVIPASVQKFGNYVFDNSTAVSIHGYANTTAQTYAENHSISFVTLDCAHTNTQTKYAYPSNACNDGYTGDVYCVDCGFLLQQGTTIPATGHTYVKVSETPASCTEAGVSKYMCSGCKQSYDVLIPATAHDYQSEVVAATCSQSGYTQYTCTVCGYSYRADYTQPGAHSFVKTTVAATCTAAGYDCYTCSVCGSAYTTGFTAPLGHDLQVIQTDDQSESNGHIFEYLRCARCMDTATDTIRTTHVTDASGHYVWKAGCYQDQVVQAGDCTHKKIVVRVCTVEDPTGTGTCTAQLRTESEAPGHRVEQWTVTLDPTCATDGQRTGTCTVCREEVHQVITAAPEYGHILQYSGSEPGVCIYTCTRCGVTERRRAAVVEAQFFDHMGAADKSTLGYVYDLNKDGTINLRDYVLLQRIAAAGT